MLALILDSITYILVMPNFRVIYHGISLKSLVFFRGTHDSLGEKTVADTFSVTYLRPTSFPEALI